MKQRYLGVDGRKNLVAALKKQKVAAGSEAAAEDMAKTGELVEVAAGKALIDQGAADQDVYLIVAGALDIEVNGRPIATRISGDHVGEMAAMQPEQRRTASVVAREDSVALRLSHDQIVKLGEHHPQIWRTFANELAGRLQQRNKLVKAINEQARVFIVCSTADKPIGDALRKILKHESCDVSLWSEGVFRSAQYDLESLERELDRSDVAIVVAQNGSDKAGDIIFELGFLMGRLGRHRAILLEPHGEKVRGCDGLPGITTMTFKRSQDANLDADLAPAVKRLHEIIGELGPNR